MYFNFDRFRVKEAVCWLLKKNDWEGVYWEGDKLYSKEKELLVEVNPIDEVVVKWEARTELAEPTNPELSELWEEGRMRYFKDLQIKKIKGEYEETLKHGRAQTTITGSDGNPIVMDVRRNATDNDIQNLRELPNYLRRKGFPGSTVRDALNQYHYLTIEQIESLLDDMVDYGFDMIQLKWQREKDIEDATSVEAIVQVKYPGL
jgi:hypothetical protein